MLLLHSFITCRGMVGLVDVGAEWLWVYYEKNNIIMEKTNICKAAHHSFRGSVFVSNVDCSGS